MNRTYFATTSPSVIGDNEAIAAYEQANNLRLKAISLVEWELLHNDRKGITSGFNPDLPAGLPTVTDYDNGTCLGIAKQLTTEVLAFDLVGLHNSIHRGMRCGLC